MRAKRVSYLLFRFTTLFRFDFEILKVKNARDAIGLAVWLIAGDGVCGSLRRHFGEKNDMWKTAFDSTAPTSVIVMRLYR